MHIQESYSTWNALRKEVNEAGSEADIISDHEWIAFNLEVVSSDNCSTTLPIKNLILDPTHPFTSEGMEPCDSCKETECIAAGDNPTKK